MNRDTRMIKAAVEAELPPAQPMVRRLSAGSVLMLELLGNPLAGLPGDGEEVSLYAVVEYAWLHAAPLGEVQGLVVRHELNPLAVREAVLAWACEVTEAQLATMVAAVRGEVATAGDALVTSVESYEAESKKV